MGCVPSKFKENSASMDSQSSQTEEFRYIDGRRYHNEENVGYHLPNDDEETDRLHEQHFIMKYIWQSNFSAPVEHILSKSGAKILDVGYPLSKVIGLDISTHQPTQIKPKNFEFVKANAQEGLPFDDNTFDFVFQRYLIAGYNKEKWQYVINEIVRVLKPGGYLELCEPSNPFDNGPVSRRIFMSEVEIFEEKGCDIDIYEKLDDYLQNQGQVENIKKEAKKIYYNAKHSNDIGLSKALVGSTMNTLVSLKPLLTKKMEISNKEYDKLAKMVEKELIELDFYLIVVRIYANKVIDK
ncbi:1331_t:CDS:2 [Dentiscutata erythropus]|uniref:1331_t:CDS:1 n=1 Tax=Dentiscutata erythropus TaxID=1348616 RepID=A0A9N9E4H0_9GLOM|nr:1331_t:CDS:2 [Dentiscutata erythropus]